MSLKQFLVVFKNRAVSYNPLNSATDIFVDSTQGNIFIVTAPSGSSLSTIYLYFNTSPTVPGNISPVNGTMMTLLFVNNTSRTVTVNLGSGPIIKKTANTIVIPTNNRSNIVFAGYGNFIVEVSRSGSMAA